MPKPDCTPLPTDSALMLRNFPPAICEEIAELANPSGLGRLSETGLQKVRTSLSSTCKDLKACLVQATKSESQDLTLIHEAFKAAREGIELLHQPT
jgi:hypothetical protein